MRYAVYFAPGQETLLHQAGSAFLGRDALTGERVSQPVPAGMSPERFSGMTADARRYGFHATLKAPFSLASGSDVERLGARMAEIAASSDSFFLSLAPARIAGFIALVPREPSPSLDKLAARLVVDLDDLRAPLTEDDLARRRRAQLDRVEDDYLVRYGYPYVLDRFKFHMTLSSRLEATEAGTVLDFAHQSFDGLLGTPVNFDRIALFVEPSPGADFVIANYYPLRRIPDEGAV